MEGFSHHFTTERMLSYTKKNHNDITHIFIANITKEIGIKDHNRIVFSLHYKP